MFAAGDDSAVWHQAVGVDHHAKLRHRLLDRLQKPHAVRIIAINRLAFVASGRNMINGVGIFHSDWSCHRVKITAADDNCQVSRVDPFTYGLQDVTSQGFKFWPPQQNLWVDLC